MSGEVWGARGERVGLWRAALQAAALLGIAALLAFSVNAVRPTGAIDPFGAPPRAAGAAAPDLSGLEVALDEAAALHLTGGAVFLDARSATAFRAGHVSGAKNLPPKEAKARAAEVLAGAPKDGALIAYCDGEGCILSVELAQELLALGYTNVRVLAGGWDAWRGAGLPTEGP